VAATLLLTLLPLAFSFFLFSSSSSWVHKESWGNLLLVLAKYGALPGAKPTKSSSSQLLCVCVCAYYKIGDIKAPGPAVNIYARLYPLVLSDATTNSISPPLYWTVSLHDGLKGGGGEREMRVDARTRKKRGPLYIYLMGKRTTTTSSHSITSTTWSLYISLKNRRV
jgi:hypothetical protein